MDSVFINVHVCPLSLDFLNSFFNIVDPCFHMIYNFMYYFTYIVLKIHNIYLLKYSEHFPVLQIPNLVTDGDRT